MSRRLRDVTVGQALVAALVVGAGIVLLVLAVFFLLFRG
jgi:hypothetical protein